MDCEIVKNAFTLKHLRVAQFAEYIYYQINDI